MPPCWKNPGWHIATYVIFWCSAFVNPIIYIVCNRFVPPLAGTGIFRIPRRLAAIVVPNVE